VDEPPADGVNAAEPVGRWQLTARGLSDGASARQSFGRFVLTHLARPLELVVERLPD
jgi:hypothetical protein